MTTSPHRNRCPHPAACAAWLWLAALPALAGPGAHGPNGEHLDAPPAARAAAAVPRVEASTDAFELVATLQGGALAILIDRYASNEPVLGAGLEVESGGLKAKASFRADEGDYAVADAKLLALLQTPGEHALVFTLVAGQDSDLLDGTLVTGGAGARAADDHGHDHGHGLDLQRAGWVGAGIAGLGLVGGIAWWRQRRRAARPLQGGQR